MTYVSTTSAGNLVSGLRSLGASFEASKHAERPDFVYANAGAHIFRNGKGNSLEPSGFAVLSALRAFAQSHSMAPHTLVWGTAVVHRSWARLDDELLPQLSLSGVCSTAIRLTSINCDIQQGIFRTSSCYGSRTGAHGRNR